MRLFGALLACTAMILSPLIFAQGPAKVITQSKSPSADSPGIETTTTVTTPSYGIKDIPWSTILAMLGTLTALQLFITQFFIRPVVVKEVKDALKNVPSNESFTAHTLSCGQFQNRVDMFMHEEMEDLRARAAASMAAVAVAAATAAAQAIKDAQDHK